jgi:hypothetical protein
LSFYVGVNHLGSFDLSLTLGYPPLRICESQYRWLNPNSEMKASSNSSAITRDTPILETGGRAKVRTYQFNEQCNLRAGVTL